MTESTETITLDPERQAQARRYARIQRRAMLADLLIGGVYVLAWLALGWSQALQQALAARTANQWLQVAGFTLVFAGFYALISLPLSYYTGFVLPHRFGLSTQTLKGWVTDLLKGGLVGGIIGLLLIEVIYGILRAFPETWWLWAAGFLLLFNVVLANLAPVLILPLFYKLTPLSQDYADLAERLIQLSARAHTRVRGVFQFDMSSRTKAANAALTGLGNTRRIILGDTLLTQFSADEIETVMAHELGHQVHRDLPTGILVETLITLVGLYLASLGLAWGVTAFGFSSPADVAAMPLLVLVLGLYGLLTMPLSNGYSRWRERRADEYALEATGKPAAYASALRRLANQNLAEADPEPWVEFLLYSHPALNKRIAMAEGAERG